MAFDSKAAAAPLRISAPIESEFCFQIGRFYCCVVLSRSAAKSWDYDRDLSFRVFFHAMTLIQ